MFDEQYFNSLSQKSEKIVVTESDGPALGSLQSFNVQSSSKVHRKYHLYYQRSKDDRAKMKESIFSNT